MIIRTLDEVTSDAVAAMKGADNPRFREIMVALVTHLHAFVREVRLTEVEFREAAAILEEMGKLTSDTHNELVLMAGSLGVSSLVCLLNNGDGGATETSQSVLGPFWRLNSPQVANGGTIVQSDTPGDPLFVTARVVDRAGEPIAGAEVDVWHASPVGLYENQDPEQAEMNLRGKFVTDSEGRFWFSTVKMVGYPIPIDGVVGRMLNTQHRQPNRPAHLHALIFKPGFKVLISRRSTILWTRISKSTRNSASPGRCSAIMSATTSRIPWMRQSARPGILSTTPMSWSRVRRYCPGRRSNDDQQVVIASDSEATQTKPAPNN
jgi:catechol 1,2-dioxygenase